MLPDKETMILLMLKYKKTKVIRAISEKAIGTPRQSHDDNPVGQKMLKKSRTMLYLNLQQSGRCKPKATERIPLNLQKWKRDHL